MSRIELNPQGIVAVLKRGCLSFIPTSTEADAKALAAVIGTLGTNVTVAHGPYANRAWIAQNIFDDLDVPAGVALPID